MTSNEDTIVGVLLRSTNSARTSTNLRKVVADINTEAVQVLHNETVLETRATEVCIQKTRIFILQHFNEHRINNNPTTSGVNVLRIQQTRHTSNDHQRRHRSRRQRCSTRQTRRNRNRVVTTSGKVAEGIAVELHRGQQLISTSRRICLRTREGSAGSVGIAVQSRLLETSEVAKDVLIEVVSESICSTIRGQREPIDVRLSGFDVVELEGKIVCLVNDEREIAVIKILSSDLRTASIRADINFRLQNHADCVPHPRDFTKVIGVGDSLGDRRLSERDLYLFAVQDRAEIALA